MEIGSLSILLEALRNLKMMGEVIWHHDYVLTEGVQGLPTALNALCNLEFACLSGQSYRPLSTVDVPDPGVHRALLNSYGLIP